MFSFVGIDLQKWNRSGNSPAAPGFFDGFSFAE